MPGQYNGLQDDGNHVHDNTKQGYVSLPAYLPEQSATLHNSKLALKLGDALDKRKSQKHNHGGRMDSNDFLSTDDSSSYLSDDFCSTDWGSVDSMTNNDFDDSITKRLEEVPEESELQEEVKKTYKEEEVEKIKAQFAEELYAIQQDLTNTVSKVTSLTEVNTQLKDNLKNITEENVQLQGKLESTQKTLGEKDSTITQLTKGNTQQNPNPDNENKKLLAVSAQSRKQITYASVSFVLSGAFAVGASLTMSHLAICISLAVAALTFLTVGCYCSYKANTALSNVEIDNCVNPAVVEV